MPDARAVEELHRRLMTCWNSRDAAGYSDLFVADGTIVGFDGSTVSSVTDIGDHVGGIFADHDTPTYVWVVREVRELAPDVALLLADVGMVPPGGADIAPEANAVQSMVAVRTDGGLRVAHFHNTPAALHGRPDAVERLTEELRAELRRGRGDGG